jgi:hypothetical protein
MSLIILQFWWPRLKIKQKYNPLLILFFFTVNRWHKWVYKRNTKKWTRTFTLIFYQERYKLLKPSTCVRSPVAFSGVHCYSIFIYLCSVFCVEHCWFVVDTFSVELCIVCPLIDRFWLPLVYLQTFLMS